MKKVLVSILMLGATGIAFAGKPLVAEAPINAVTTATTVSVSTSAWTLVPAAGNTAGRVGLYVSNPATTSVAGVLVATGDSAPATTIRPLEFYSGNGNYFVPISDQVNLYLLSLDAGALSVHVQEAKK